MFVVGELVARLSVEDKLTPGLDGADQGLKKVEVQAGRTSTAVKKMSSDNAAAYQRQQAAAKRLMIAEQDLAEMKASGTATSKQMLQAEARVASARGAAISSTSRYTSTSRQLASAQTAAGNAARGHQRSVSSLNSTLATTRNLLASVGVGLSAAMVVKFFTDSVAAARALGAQTNQLNVVFGENAGQITAWGKTAVDTMRMSQREAQGAAVQFATFGKAMGLAGQDLVNFSKEQTKLAADLASFQGIPVADAIQAMGSAYAGETETMRKYGVLLDENTIKQAAYANGVAKVGSQLTAQQKAQGAYYAMQQQLVHVNGDVERSNGKFGASLKTLTARLEEVQASVGQKLIPVIQPFVDLLAGPGLTALEGTATAVGAVGKAFGSLPAPVQAALAAIVAFRIAQKLAGDQMASLGERARTAYTGVQRSMSDVTRAAALSGTQISRSGAAVVALGRHVPIVDRMRQSFVQASASASHMPRTIGAASAAMTGMKGAASGLIGALGGPWGLAITGATVALSMWISKKQKDAQASQDAEARTRGYSDAISEAGGVIDDQVRAMVSKELADANAYEMAKKLGIGEKELTDAVIGRGKALDDIIAKTKDIDNLPKLMEGLDGDIDEKNAAVARFADSLKNAKTELTDAEKRSGELSNATEKAKVSFDSAGQATKSMSAAMEAYSEETGGAAAQVDKLAKALKGLADDKLTQEEADQSWYDGMRDLTKTLGETQAAVIGVSGAIDVTTESGSKLQDSVVSQRDAYYEVAAAAKRYTDEQQMLGKMDAGQALDYMNGKLGPLRQSFIDAATAAGHSADEAKRMADHYLGLPGEITTQLELKGADAAIAKLDAMKVKGAARIEGTYHVTDNTPEVRAKLDSLKVAYKIIDGKIVIDENGIAKARGALEELGVETESLPDGYIKIEDTSPENMARLESLGIKVQTLPNGTIVINAEDAAFWAAANRAMAPGSKPIVLEPQVNQAALAAALATIPGASAVAVATPNAAGSIRAYMDGGIQQLESYANGGTRLPQQAVIQQADPSGGLVQWAEPSTHGEAFIPMNPANRVRSEAILAEVARRFGLRLMPAAGGGFGALMRRVGYTAMAEGGVLSAGALKSYMRGLDGASYVWGGWGQGFNTDCSGGQSIAVNATNGNTSAGSGQRSATAGYSSWLPSQGYTLGRAPSGVPAHEIGWSPEHTSGTIFDPAGGDVNIEMGGANGGGKYGSAVGSRDGQFGQQAWRALGGDDGTIPVPTSAPPPRTSGTGRLEEDQAPETGALGGTLIDYRDGTAYYSDGSSSDGSSWTMPAGSAGGTGASGSGAPVFVTNWPASMGGSSPSSTTTPADTVGPGTESPSGVVIKSPFMRGQKPIHMRVGGTVPGSGSGDIVPAMLEPGEEVTPKSVATQWRPFLKAIREGRVQKLQSGGTAGFGGYADDTTDYMKPTSWTDWAALLTGGALTATSVAAPYIGMLQSGQVDLGNLSPTMDTGSNDIPAIGEMVGDYANQISDQLATIAQLLAKGERVTVTIQSDDQSAASMVAMAARV